MAFEIKHGDCLVVMRGMADNSVDAVVTDPPYGLSFMGKKWDYDVPSVEVWAECLRVLKPGGHLLAFAGTRTQHRMAVRIEDAGFEIRDMIAWVYGTGFPKSLDVSKAIDKAAGEEREVVGPGRWNHVKGDNGTQADCLIRAGGKHVETAPATEAARQWQGWGTALKPSLEPITVARKPLIGTVAANVLAHGTGALNIDGSRVDLSAEDAAYIGERIGGFNATNSIGGNGAYSGGETMDRAAAYDASKGRWPANLIHDGSEEVLRAFLQTTSGGGNKSRRGSTEGGNCYGTYKPPPPDIREVDTGSAARFFYVAKASKADRDEGLEHLPEVARSSEFGQLHPDTSESGNTTGNYLPRRNHHPTVKPTALMRYLVRLVTPPGGTVLDPFTGSGSTGKAAMLEGFNFIGIEREAEYVAIAEARIAEAQRQIGLFA